MVKYKCVLTDQNNTYLVGFKIYIELTFKQGKHCKMAEWKDPELTSSYRHTKITTMCRTTIVEND